MRETSSSSVMSLVTRSASLLTVSSMTRFCSSVKRSHLASMVAVKPLTLVSGERSSWATVETRSARLRSSRARAPPSRRVIVTIDVAAALRLAYEPGRDIQLLAAGQVQRPAPAPCS